MGVGVWTWLREVSIVIGHRTQSGEVGAWPQCSPAALGWGVMSIPWWASCGKIPTRGRVGYMPADYLRPFTFVAMEMDRRSA